MRFLELLWFSAYAELKAEASRSYLGFVWWLLEPAMFMAVFYVVFGMVLKRGGDDYLAFLLIGLTFWQWFKSCISHGSHAIWLNIPLMQQVRLPAALFPCSTVVSDTVKFLFIFAVLLAILWSSGYPPWWGYVVLPLLFMVQLLLATACCLIAAAIVPFVPDVRFVIENALMALMFVSGVVFSLDAIEGPVSDWLALNPMVGLIESARSVLMHQQLPNWSLLAQAAAGSVLVMLLALLMLHRLAPRYPKLVT